MPKNNPKPQLPRNPRPSNPKPPKVGSGGNSPDGHQTVLVSLVQLNEAALSGLQAGEPVSIRAVGTSLQVFTPIGTYIGAIGASDSELLSGKRIRRARVCSVSLSPAQCIVEVTV
jgi:hypothetical protein